MYGDPFLPGYEQVYQIGSGGYDWSEFRAFRKDGRIFYADSSGCSCSYYEENVSEVDLIELATLEAARRALKEFFTSHHYDYEDQITPYLDAVEKFRELGLR